MAKIVKWFGRVAIGSSTSIAGNDAEQRRIAPLARRAKQMAKIQSFCISAIHGGQMYLLFSPGAPLINRSEKHQSIVRATFTTSAWKRRSSSTTCTSGSPTSACHKRESFTASRRRAAQCIGCSPAAGSGINHLSHPQPRRIARIGPRHRRAIRTPAESPRLPRPARRQPAPNPLLAR